MSALVLFSIGAIAATMGKPALIVWALSLGSGFLQAFTYAAVPGFGGWLPRYLSHGNAHGAPTRARWTDLGFNLLLLLMSGYVFVLAISNAGYIIFKFQNLNAGWIHRLDRPHWKRPWKAPNWLLRRARCSGS